MKRLELILFALCAVACKNYDESHQCRDAIVTVFYGDAICPFPGQIGSMQADDRTTLFCRCPHDAGTEAADAAAPEAGAQ